MHTQQFWAVRNYIMTSLVLQVSDAISHAVDAPAEPKKAPEWRQLHEKYAKEMLPLKASHCLWHAGRAEPAYSHCVSCTHCVAAITMARENASLSVYHTQSSYLCARWHTKAMMCAHSTKKGFYITHASIQSCHPCI